MDFSLTQLRRLAALSETRTFSAGADATYRSQAAFSRSIAALEASLGATLVDRSGYKHRLTDCGRIVLEHAQRVLAEAERLAEAVEAHNRGSAGSMQLGLGPTPSALLTAPLLSYAAAQPRGLRLALTPGRNDLLEAALLDRRVDALIVDANSILASPDLEILPLGALPVGVLARPGHPLAKRRKVEFEDLLDFPVLSTELTADMARYMVERFGPRAHPDSLVHLRSQEVGGLLTTAAQTDAVFIGVVAAGHEAVRLGQLCRLNFDAGPYCTPYAYICLNGRSQTPLFRTVRTIAESTLRSLAGEASAA